MAFAAGAVEVLPGVAGFDARVTDPARLDALEAAPPLDPRAWSSVVTHLFGTCRMSSDPARGVVRPDFRHHTTDRLWIADSSVFPTNTGVNPQTSILAMATLAGRAIGEALATTA
jgi:choline dehydrogenase-like flavoprotein